MNLCGTLVVAETDVSVCRQSDFPSEGWRVSAATEGRTRSP